MKTLFSQCTTKSTRVCLEIHLLCFMKESSSYGFRSKCWQNFDSWLRTRTRTECDEDNNKCLLHCSYFSLIKETCFLSSFSHSAVSHQSLVQSWRSERGIMNWFDDLGCCGSIAFLQSSLIEPRGHDRASCLQLTAKWMEMPQIPLKRKLLAWVWNRKASHERESICLL